MTHIVTRSSSSLNSPNHVQHFIEKKKDKQQSVVCALMPLQVNIRVTILCGHFLTAVNSSSNFLFYKRIKSWEEFWLHRKKNFRLSLWVIASFTFNRIDYPMWETMGSFVFLYLSLQSFSIHNYNHHSTEWKRIFRTRNNDVWRCEEWIENSLNPGLNIRYLLFQTNRK